MLCLKNSCTGWLALVALVLLLLVPVKSFAAASPRAVLIIDGSGSMWGRIDGREKIVIVRNQLAAQLKTLVGQVDLGVMSYGHRRRRDCRDIEMIKPIAPVNIETYGSAIKHLLPRGKTPISSALQMAAKALAKGQGNKNAPLHIVLVADGVENCRLDPCETARTLATTYPQLTIDVIGFGVPQKDLPQLQCITKATKGRFRRADHAKPLKDAIHALFSNLGLTESQHLAKPKKKTDPAGLYLSAGLSDQGRRLAKQLRWRIYRSGESAKTGATPLKRDQKAAPFFDLPSGSYHVEVRYRSLLAQEDIQLGAGKAMKKHLSFNRGLISAQARLADSQPPLGDLIFSLYDISRGPAGPANIIAHKQGKKAEFYLAPGKYSLKARISEAQASQDFNLMAGDQKQLSLLLNAGVVNLQTTLAKGTKALNDVQYALFRQGQNGHRDSEFVRTLDPTPHLVLPAGNYFVLARHDAASAYQGFIVNAGDHHTMTLVLAAGILSLSGHDEKQGSGQQARIAYSITPVPPTHPKTIKLSEKGALGEVDQPLPIRSLRHTFTLPAGTYQIKALYGNSNATTSQRVSLQAGQRQQVKMDMNAGQVHLSLSLAPGDPPLPGVFWSISDQNGHPVASASSPAPRLTLAKGRYQAIAQYLGRSYHRDFTLTKGENKALKMSVE